MDDRTPPTDDEAVARVRAADPASGAEPDARALRADVDQRIGVVGTTVDELAVRRSRRWTSWPARLAGAAAATLVIGMGGGYALGSADGDAVGALPPITLNAPGPAPEGMGGAEMAADSDGRGGGMSDSAVWPGYWGRTVFTASGLSEAGGTSRAWSFDPSTVFTDQSVAALAAALGVAGTPEQQDWGWVVGPQDGSGATVQMYADGLASVYYYDPAKDLWRCEPSILPEPAPDTASEDVDPSSGAGSMPVDPCTEQDLGPAPQGDAAIAQVRDTMAAIGVDVGQFEFAVEDYGDEAWTYVTARQVIDGQQSGLTWSASLSGGGIQSLNGSLAPLVDLGEYEVVSPAEAVLRLSDPRFGSSGGGYYPMDGGDVVMMDTPRAPEVPGPVTPGARIGWPVAQVAITDARLGLAMHFQPDGGAVMVPTYELISADGAIWTVIAVADSQLDFSAER